jgi:hypothetical protein
MSSMKYVSREEGSVATIVTMLLLVVLLAGSLGFAGWAYSSRQDYKKNVDSKVEAAVKANTAEVQAQDAKDYAEAAKSPLKTFTGPEAYGSLRLAYPRTWSGYSAGTESNPVDLYFGQDIVPPVENEKSIFAFRAQVLSTPYSTALATYQSVQQTGKVTVAPYKLPKTPSVVGVRIDGQLTETVQGSVVLLPLRDKTVKLWTESPQYLSDFNSSILPNVSFSP